MILPDLLDYNLDVVFCGTAVPPSSAKKKQYYAYDSNKFYRALAEAKLTPFQISPAQYPDLLKYNIGLTDLVKHKAAIDKYLKDEDYDIPSFIEKIMKYQPKYVCFNGIKAGKKAMGLGDWAKVEYGLQKQKFGNTALFIAPSTADNANTRWEIGYYQELKRLMSI